MNYDGNAPYRAVELEHSIAALVDGALAEDEFRHVLSLASLWILVDRDHGASRQWHSDTNMLFLSDVDGNVMAAAFTAPDHAVRWCEAFPNFAHGMLLDFNWILARLPASAGLVINPASALEIRIASARLDAFKLRH